MTRLALEDPLLDAHLVRVAGTAAARGLYDARSFGRLDALLEPQRV